MAGGFFARLGRTVVFAAAFDLGHDAFEGLELILVQVVPIVAVGRGIAALFGAVIGFPDHLFQFGGKIRLRHRTVIRIQRIFVRGGAAVSAAFDLAHDGEAAGVEFGVQLGDEMGGERHGILRREFGRTTGARTVWTRLLSRHGSSSETAGS